MKWTLLYFITALVIGLSSARELKYISSDLIEDFKTAVEESVNFYLEDYINPDLKVHIDNIDLSTRRKVYDYNLFERLEWLQYWGPENLKYDVQKQVADIYAKCRPELTHDDVLGDIKYYCKYFENYTEGPSNYMRAMILFCQLHRDMN